VQPFQDLKVWSKSHDLALQTYRVSRALIRSGERELAWQLRRAVVSVPANLAEGSKKTSPKDYARYLNIAEGSIGEVQYLLILARDLGELTIDAVTPLLEQADEVARMLYSLRTRVHRAAE
jgi:four helix bundle protein